MKAAAALAIRITALFVASLTLTGHSRLPGSRFTVLGLLALALIISRLGRLPELAEWRRLWRNSNDPTFQGDGWRWTVCLLLPNVLLWSSPRRNDRWAGCPVRAPFTLDMLVLTREQKRVCFVEFWQAQVDQRDGPLERWETIDREEP